MKSEMENVMKSFEEVEEVVRVDFQKKDFIIQIVLRIDVLNMQRSMVKMLKRLD